jgi:hypothetical protein
MPRFSLKELFISITLIGLGIGCAVKCTQSTMMNPDPYMWWYFFASVPLIVAGIFALFQRAWTGAWLSIVVLACFALLAFLLIRSLH